MRKFFIGQYIDNDKFPNSLGVSNAGNNFQNKLVSSGYFNDCYSINPIYFVFKSYMRSPLPLKFIMKLFYSIYSFFCCVVISFKLRSGDSLFFYNHQLVYFPIIKFAKLRGINCFLILADANPKDLKNNFIDVINSYRGTISLNAIPDWKSFENFKVIPGIADSVAHQNNVTPNKSDKFILFSGALNKFTGIELALNVFSKLPNINLIITGGGELQTLAQEFSDRYKNINYLGFVENKKYISLLNQAMYGLNFRDMSIEENKYNFPSKVIEYASYGIPVISKARYEHIPKDILIDVSEENETGLIEALSSLINDQELAYLTGTNSLGYFKKNCSITAFCENLDLIIKE